MGEKVENLALTNPLSKIIDKGPKDFTREDLIKVIEEKEIERITFHYTGVDGKIKELKLPVNSKRYAELVLTEGERADGSSLFKGMVDPGKSDLYVVPKYSTAFLNPFVEGSLDFVCRFINPQGELAEFPPDNILRRASDMLKDNTGFDLHALGELEFFLLSDPENRTFPLPKQAGYHASSPFVKNNEALNEMLRLITQIAGNVKYAHSEVGFLSRVESELEEIDGKMAEQVEVEFLPTPIEETGDSLVLAKWIIRNVAYKHDCVATFAPKIEVGHAGNGMHVHLALMKDGKNAMVDSNNQLNENSKKVIGGLCKYASSLNAFGNTVAGSYLRLVPHQEAPTKVCWSEMNRSALIRVPLGWNEVENLASIVNPNEKLPETKFDSRQTVELRSPDGSCNSHLLLSGITMAVDWGLTNGEEALKISDKCYVAGNIHDEDNELNLEEIAESCEDSADVLLEHRDIFERKDIFPKNVIDFIAEKLKEEEDRDLHKRLMSLSDEEKVKESRRVMHKDLHKH